MKRLEIAAVLAAAAALVWLLAGCGDDNGGGPKNAPPVITSLTAVPDMVEPAGYSDITCSASDPDGDSLSLSWDADDGTISGSGYSITWLAPSSAGSYEIFVTVSDGRGGSVSDTTLVQVVEGTLLVTTGAAVLAFDMDGNHFVFYDNGAEVEVLETRIFLGSHNIIEVDHDGNIIASITKPPQVPGSRSFVVLPDAGFAYLDNRADTVSFIDADGAFITKLEMPNPSPDNLQEVKGTTVGNRLIVSETGNRMLAEVDLSTYEASVFRDFSSLSGYLADIDYRSGVYYLTQWNKVHTFTETGDPAELFNTGGEGNILGIAVVGRYAYTVLNFAGKMYKTDVFTGETELFAEGLNKPYDIEFIPVSLEAE